MLQEKNGIFYITFDIFKALPNVTASRIGAEGRRERRLPLRLST